MDVAILAAGMVGALNVMFFECSQRFKIGFRVTMLAFPVIAGIPDMLVVSRPGAEVAVTAITMISHLLDSSTGNFRAE